MYSHAVLKAHTEASGNNICADCGISRVEWASASVRFGFYFFAVAISLIFSSRRRTINDTIYI
jgi:hypothetical protein